MVFIIDMKDCSLTSVDVKYMHNMIVALLVSPAYSLIIKYSSITGEPRPFPNHQIHPQQ